MKTSNSKKNNLKFDLEKMNVAKLKNLRSVNGGNRGDDKTVTDLSSNCVDKQGKNL